MVTGATLRTESAPVAAKCSTARSMRPSARTGTLPYKRAITSTRGRWRVSQNSIAWRAAASTVAVSVASSGGRSITSIPRLRASFLAGAESVVKTAEVKLRLARA